MRKASIVTLLLFLLHPNNVFGCTIEPKLHRVSRDFSVQVLDWKERPVPDMHVLLLPRGRPNAETFEKITNTNGRVDFKGTAVGDYEVTINEPRGSPDYNSFTPIYVSVSNNPAAPDLASQIQLPWPDRKVLSARNSSGRLELDTSWLKNLRYRLVSFDLLEAKSRRLLATVIVDANGSFSFPAVDPGLYFIEATLRAAGEDYPWGLVAMEIDPTAKRERLEFVMHFPSCGPS